MEDLGTPTRVVGIDVTVIDNYILLNQPSYIDKVIKKFNMQDSTPKKTPMESKLKLTTELTKDHDKVKDFPYRSLVMSLLYLCICTRFDIANTCKELCRFLERPGSAMVTTAKRVVRYLLGSTTVHGDQIRSYRLAAVGHLMIQSKRIQMQMGLDKLTQANQQQEW